MDNKIIEKLDMSEVFRQKQLLIDLSAAVRKDGHNMLADELEAIIGVLDVVQDEAEDEGYFEFPEYDDSTGKVVYDRDYYNDVLQDILEDDENQKRAAEVQNAEAPAGTSGEKMQKGSHYYKAKKPIIAFEPGKVLTKFNLEVLDQILEIDTGKLIDDGDIEEIAAPSVEYFLEQGEGYAAVVRYQEIHNCDFDTASAAVLQMVRKKKASNA